MARETPKRRPAWARGARWTGRAAVALALLTLLVPSLLLLALRLPMVADSVRARALAALNSTVRGRVEASGLTLELPWRVALDGVRVVTPEGVEALAADRLELALTPSALLTGRLVLERVAISRPKVLLTDACGRPTFARAFEAREPSTRAADPSAGLSPVDLEIGALQLRDGTLRFDPTPSSPGFDGMGLDARVSIGEAVTWSDVRLEATPVGLPLGAAVLTTHGTMTSDSLTVAALSLDAGATRLALHGAVDLAPLRIDVTLDDLAADPAALGLPIAGVVSLAGTARGTLSNLELGVSARTAAGDLTLDGRADLSGAAPAWTFTLRSPHVAPSALTSVTPAGLEGAFTAWSMGEGNPLEQGFALLELDVSQVTVHDEPLGSLSVKASALRGVLDGLVTVAGAAGEHLRVEAQGALPPAAATLVLDAEGLELGAWGRRLGLDGLRGRVDTAHVALTAALGPGGIANAVADVALVGTGVGVHAPLAPFAATADVRLGGYARWPGSGSPTGRLQLDVAHGAGEGATLGRSRIDLHLTRPRGTSDARLRASVTATGVALPGHRRLDEASLTLDARMPAEPAPAFDKLEGYATLAARGLTLPEATLARTEARLDVSPEGRRVHLRGPLTLRGLTLPGLISLESAAARADVLFEPAALELTGEAALAVAGLRAGTFELHTAAVSVSRDAAGVSRLALSAERGPLRFDTRLAVVGLSLRSKRLITTLEALRVNDGITGLEASPGATVELAGNGDLRVAGLALKGIGDLAPSTLDVTGDYLPLAHAVDGRVTLQGVDVGRWLRFVERVSGQALPQDVQGLVDGSVRVAGTPASPTVTAALKVSGGRLGPVHDASASLEGTLTAGRVSARGSATWAPKARVSFQVEAPATLNLERDHLRLHLPSDAEVRVRADAADLDLGLLGVSVQGSPLQGTLNGALQVDGPLQRPLAVVGLRVAALTLGGLDGVDVDAALVLQEASTVLNLQLAHAHTIPIRLEADLPLNVATLASLSSIEALRRLSDTPCSIALVLKEVRLGTLPFLAARFPDLEETTVAGEVRVSGTLAAPAAAGALAVRKLQVGDLVADLDLSLTTEGPLVKLGLRAFEAERTLATLDLTVPDLVNLLSTAGPGALLLSDGLRLDVDVPGFPFQRVAEVAPEVGELLVELLGPGMVAASASLIAAKKGPTLAARARARGDRPLLPGAPEPFARELLFDAVWLPGDARVTLGFQQRRRVNALTVEAKAPLDLVAVIDGSGPPLDQVPLNATARTSAFDLRGLSSFLPQVFGSSQGELEVSLDITGTLAKPNVQGFAELHFDELAVAAAGLYQQGVVARIDVLPDALRLQPLELRSEGGAFDLAVTVAVPTFAPDDIALNGALRLDRFRILGRDDASAVMSGSASLGGTLAAPVVAGDLTFDEARLSPALGGRKLQTVGVPDDVVFVTADGLEEASVGASARARRLAGALVLDLGVHLPSRHVRIVNDMVDIMPAGDLKLLAQGGPLSIEGQISVVEGTVEFYGKRFVLSDQSLVVFTGGTTIDPRLDVSAVYDISHVDLEPLGLSSNADSNIRLAVTGTASKPVLELSSDPSMDQTSIISTMLVGSPIGSGQTRAQEAGVERQTLNMVVGLATGQLAQLLTGDLPIDVFRVEAGEQGLATARITVGKRLTRDLTVFYEADLGAQPGENQNEVRVQYRLTRRLQLETHVGDAGRGGLDLLLRWRF